MVSATVAERGLHVAFGVAAGEVLAVLGPNGAGKSTTAGVIAGLLRGDPALVRVGDRTLTDTERGVFVPVHDRRVGLLLQNPLLFPHLSVLGNVLFAAGRGVGPRADRKVDARTRAQRWLERVGTAGLADRAPGELSGGRPSGSRWPAHWPPTPTFWFWTNRCGDWMSRLPPVSVRNCGEC